VKLYFLTLLSPRYQELGHEPRCIGFSETPFTPDRLTEAGMAVKTFRSSSALLRM
jgi:hypothetical protein